MRYSKLFGKTKKDSKEFDSKNATFLIKGGFIDQTMSGVYKFLPLGLRVLKKIEGIIREEMDSVAQEMLLSALAPREFYTKTSRDNIDVLFEARGANDQSIKRNSTSYILNPTHEDNITPMVAQFVKSYKDLPIALYQFQFKFRNEARAKSGLLRGREFYMKDLYSFHTDLADFEKYYEIIKLTYKKIFERLGIGDITFLALASGGDFTKNYSHEFQTKCEAGEDLIFFDEESETYFNREVTPTKVPNYPYSLELRPMQEVYGPGIKSVEKLIEFLNIKVEECIKTILYQADSEFVTVAVRGDYEVNELKVKNVLGCSNLQLATEEQVYELTAAEIGYAGILNLPESVPFLCDDALENMTNFEVGSNKTDYHSVNVNWGRDIKKPDKFYDLKVAKIGDLNPKTNQPYKVFKSAEVGNIFPLETKFPDAFDFTYTNQSGERKKIYMGSYGIGVSRLVGVIAEVLSDSKGIIWPKNIAPYKVHIVSLCQSIDDEVMSVSENLYNNLISKGLEVLWDDRVDISPGEKFADSDLIGIPYRIVVSAKTISKNLFELKPRTSTEAILLNMQDLLNLLTESINDTLT